MKKRALFLIPIAALLLSGCSEPGADDVKPTSTLPSTVATQQLDAQDLAEIADEIAGNHENAVIVDEETLKAQIPLAEQARKAMKVTPEACAVFVTGDAAEELEKMNLVSVTLPGNTEIEAMEIGIGSYGEVADAEANLAKGAAILKDCSEFTLTLAGQEMKMKLEELEATTVARKTEAYRAVVDTVDTKTTSVAVSGIQGANLVSVTITGGTDEGKDLAEAQERANAVLRMLAKKSS